MSAPTTLAERRALAAQIERTVRANLLACVTTGKSDIRAGRNTYEARIAKQFRVRRPVGPTVLDAEKLLADLRMNSGKGKVAKKRPRRPKSKSVAAGGNF